MNDTVIIHNSLTTNIDDIIIELNHLHPQLKVVKEEYNTVNLISNYYEAKI